MGGGRDPRRRRGRLASRGARRGGGAAADGAGDLRGTARRPSAAGARRGEARRGRGPPLPARGARGCSRWRSPTLALDTLVRRVARLRRRRRTCSLGPSHSYRHALLRDAGYASLARAERARLHVRLADWLAERPEQSRPALAEVIGRHYAAALDGAPALARDIGGLERDEVRARAAEWFETAARVALGFAAWASARDLAARALELSDEEGLERARRLHLLGEATASAVGVDEALPLLEESARRLPQRRGRRCARRASSTPRAPSGVCCGRRRSSPSWSSSPTVSCVELGERGGRGDGEAARAPRLRRPRRVGRLRRRARPTAERALALARRAGDADAELEALQLADRLHRRGTTSWRRQRWAEIESLARARGRWELVGGGRCALGRSSSTTSPNGRSSEARTRRRARGGPRSRRTRRPGSTTGEQRRTSPPAAGTTRSRSVCARSRRPRRGTSSGWPFAPGSRCGRSPGHGVART